MTAYRIKWPMIGDSLTHGMLVSLILHLQKIPATYAPLAPSIPIVYPQGFHTVSAFFISLVKYVKKLLIEYTKKGKLYCICDDCGLQLFIRVKKCIKKLDKSKS